MNHGHITITILNNKNGYARFFNAKSEAYTPQKDYKSLNGDIVGLTFESNKTSLNNKIKRVSN